MRYNGTKLGQKKRERGKIGRERVILKDYQKEREGERKKKRARGGRDSE